MCISGQILRGLKKPHDCPAFGKDCTPQTPLGATMVSAEGACAAYYAYGRLEADARGGGMSEARRWPRRVHQRAARHLPGAARRLRPHPARARQRRPADADLIPRLFLPAFGNDVLAALEDQATCVVARRRARALAFTTDSFVVRPLFFPGGDIGRLAVHGTVNDLAVGGATPLFLSAAFILEEGLALDDLRRIVASMRAAATKRACAGHRRHQGRRSRQGRSGLHHHVRHRRRPDGPVAVDPRRAARATASWSRARSATTASPSCRCARASSSRRSWRATPPRCTT